MEKKVGGGSPKSWKKSWGEKKGGSKKMSSKSLKKVGVKIKKITIKSD